MTNAPKTMADIFEEEEAAAIAKHQAWLADPVAQAAYQADVAKRQAALDAAYEAQFDDPSYNEPDSDEPEDDEDEQDEEEDEE